ncbi:hypothetical protein ACFUTX_15230 [Microbacterium sp. NPDC057407]|uniref:hypothetical protein n=1 Tax=Microbacterium sp. NPDC057407 TaxID=3346120 RepID=UPI00366E9010
MVLVLAGCNRNYELLGPYALGFDGENVLVAVCEDRVVDRLFMSQATRTGGSVESERIWEARGEASLSAGEWLVVSGSNPGLVNSRMVAPDPGPGVRYNIGINDVPSPYYSASFTIPDDGLAEGDWVSPTGDVRSTPCG